MNKMFPAKQKQKSNDYIFGALVAQTENEEIFFIFSFIENNKFKYPTKYPFPLTL